MGELVAGSALQIRNKNNKFLVDEKGATLVDASFTMTTANDAARVTINPSTGFRVQAKESGGWTDKIYLDANGNATFAGKIISASGTIGGINIGAGSLYSTTRDSSGKP